MNGLEEEPMAPQTFLYGCELEAGKDVVFNPDDDEFEHQLDLRMACVDPGTKDELHMVEVEGQDIEGQKIKAVLVSLKPSTLPSVCLGGFTVTPPVVFRLKAGAGPVHLSGQHLVMGIDQSFSDEEDEGEEEEEEEDVKDVKTSKKRPATSPADKSKKKMKMEVDEEEDEDDDDEDEDEEDEDDEEEDEDEEEESPVKATPPAAKPKAAAQNGKSPKPSTPGKNEVKTPKAKTEKSPKTPSKEPLTIQQVKDKVLESIKKGVSLPKVELKFVNFVKNSYKVSDDKMLGDLWKWAQTIRDTK